jgi:hypothetical protein
MTVRKLDGNFEIDDNILYYVVIYPVLKDDRKSAVVLPGNNIKAIRAGFIQFGHVDNMKGVYDDTLVYMGKNFCKPFRAMIGEMNWFARRKALRAYEEAIHRFLLSPSPKYLNGMSSYENGIFKMHLCRPFIMPLCPHADWKDAMMHMIADFKNNYLPPELKHIAETVERQVCEHFDIKPGVR